MTNYYRLNFIGREWYEKLQWDENDIDNQNPFHYTTPYEQPPTEKWDNVNCPFCTTSMDAFNIGVGWYACNRCYNKWNKKQLNKNSLT